MFDDSAATDCLESSSLKKPSAFAMHSINGWTVVRKLLVAAALCATASAHAAYTLYVYESAGDVVTQGSGAVNTAGLTLLGSPGNFVADVWANTARVTVGTGSSTLWQGISGPTNFGGPAVGFSSSNNTGPFIGVFGSNSTIRLPTGYVSGTPLQNSSRWNGRSLASMGLNPGTYTYSWGAGPISDSFTVLIGTAPPLQPQSITFTAPGAQVLGTSLTVTATASSGLPVSFSTATAAVCTVSPSGVVTLVSAGTCTLNADQGGDGSFSAAPQVQQTFAVAAVPITPVTPGAPASIPTLSEWSVVLLTSLVAMFGLARTRRRG